MNSHLKFLSEDFSEEKTIKTSLNQHSILML